VELTLSYTNQPYIGYGRLGIDLQETLAEAGVTLYKDNRESPRTNTVSLVSVPTHLEGYWQGQYTSVFTMWEATRLPEGFRENMGEVDLIMVPSAHNLELFSHYHDNVKLVPLGIDPKRWDFVKRTPPGLYFDFLIGGSGARKGIDIAYSAFLEAFPEGSWGSGPVPRLVMKNPKGEPYHHERVSMNAGRMSNEDECNLYATAHCYLQPSRGEGFGLQPLQAIAQGIPTILTDAHGHEAFAHLGIGLNSTLVPAEYFIFGDAGNWWEPNQEELIEQMRWVYNNYDEACVNAQNSSALARQQFTREKTAKAFIQAHEGSLDVPYSGTGEWIKTEGLRYPVRVNQAIDCSIGERRLNMLPGVDYFETADVKRVLFEAGFLDLATVDKEGLTVKQVAQMDIATAEVCEGCGRPKLVGH